MDTKFFFIVFVLLIDHGSPYFAEHREFGGGNGIESYAQKSSNDVSGESRLPEAQARSRRQTTAVATTPMSLLGSMMGLPMGMLGGVMRMLMPGSLEPMVTSMVTTMFRILTRPFMFVARSLGKPVERMANNMLDKSKEIVMKYCTKMMMYAINSLIANMPMIDNGLMKLAENPDIPVAARSTMKTMHVMYKMLRTFGFLNST